MPLSLLTAQPRRCALRRGADGSLSCSPYPRRGRLRLPKQTTQRSRGDRGGSGESGYSEKPATWESGSAHDLCLGEDTVPAVASHSRFGCGGFGLAAPAQRDSGNRENDEEDRGEIG